MSLYFPSVSFHRTASYVSYVSTTSYSGTTKGNSQLGGVNIPESFLHSGSASTNLTVNSTSASAK